MAALVHATKAKASSAKPPQSLSIPMSDVASEKVDWLWFPYIPLAKATMLDGDPDAGKSFLTMEIASRLSRGERLPGMTAKPKLVTVLLMAMEDGAEDTIRPRLDASGADVKCIHLLTDKELLLDDAGVKRLKAEVLRLGAKLVIIDPLGSYLPTGGSLNERMRPVINRLVSLAAETGAAVLIVRHLNKGSEGPAIYRGAGDIAIIAGCRSGLIVGKDRDNPEKSILAHYKHNLSGEGTSLTFTKKGGKFAWLGKSSLRADDLVAPAEDMDTRSAIDEAEEFLSLTLAGGSVGATEVQAQADKLKISLASVKRAKKSLGVRSTKMPGGQWIWELPAQDPAQGENQGAQTEAL